MAKKKPGEDEIKSYLEDPISHGVYFAKLSFDQETMDSFMKGIWNRLPAQIRTEVSQAELRIQPIPALHQTRTLEKLVEFGGFQPDHLVELLRHVFQSYAGWRKHKADLDALYAYILPLLRWVAYINDSPMDTSHGASGPLENYFQTTRLLRSRRGPFEPDVPIISSQDAIHISLTRHRKIYVVTAVSANAHGLEKFQEFIRKLPTFKSRVHTIGEGEAHPSGIVFQPYPAAIMAWIEGRSAIEYLPDFLREYLTASSQYYNTKEWRTSIVLCAIALETLLAEFYEQEFRKEAPDIPLGGLKEEIVREVNKGGHRTLPRGIISWIDKLNDLRIAAVHRGSRQLSAREAMECLHGLTKISLWYYYPTTTTEAISKSPT